MKICKIHPMTKHLKKHHLVICKSITIEIFRRKKKRKVQTKMLRYFNFEPSFKLWWCFAWDLFWITNSSDHRRALWTLWPSGLGKYSYAEDSQFKPSCDHWNLRSKINLEHDTIAVENKNIVIKEKIGNNKCELQNVQGRKSDKDLYKNKYYNQTKALMEKIKLNFFDAVTRRRQKWEYFFALVFWKICE